ncbi:tRNA uridine-5-carboxymethylaminomethyl(34) synthesis GTPase MnmE [Xanthobacter tagetidis]|uniref:tRNA modification GTPase MnmE n=1 Tax=Xanthobacter tagetidis TaxID=60216 RepID=A0A3L7A780_9HYPH|nr:tRNA uridine-5-carboxymethylaminomethyl(34) synthesis GTPase MnmE [Xanthobacter tagetidis]MBB6308720.1 tRNA modification GTPase [Xanthobacter tagetidis]RLP75431.1 tRNA uridine-5-carboxymethylaminomethyl(34) synthesis GTPase MnmE [Xanthobacter tagetidis]
MATFEDTIFALSSGRPPSGVAVVRLSGPAAGDAVRALLGDLPPPRFARYGALRDPARGEVLDRALVLFFPGPASTTGEDVAELHLHGGRAVVAAVLRVLGALPGLRPAEAGEFTRRAFARGKMDLAEVEGLADLVAAETEAQRRQALALASGALSRRIADWRAGLVQALALVEASIDFSDEGDVPDDLVAEAQAVIGPLAADVAAALSDADRGERVRAGLTVAIAGPPNAGKSTLLNRLAGREAAIVSPVPGTTRDVLEVHLELAGQAVLLLDTAGLRESVDMVEQEGVRRALARAEAADLVLWLSEAGEPPPAALARAIRVRTKADLGGGVPDGWIGLSTHTGEGVEALLACLETEAEGLAGGEPALVSRERQRLALAEAAGHLSRAAGDFGGQEELRAEELRLAARALDRVIGRVDVEDVLDALFVTFCIGK